MTGGARSRREGPGDGPADAPAPGARELLEVAIPVPLRRTFTYRVPSALTARVQVGSRVAVRFAGRKLAGFALGWVDRAPEGVRLADVAGVLEHAPLFPPELLGFLLAAAEYYLHPVGEVLRAAAPALSSRTVRELRSEGFLEGTERLPGRTVGRRSLTWARFVRDPAPGVRLGRVQAEVLAAVRAAHEAPLADLRGLGASARAATKKLASLGLLALEEREALADPFFAALAAGEPAPAPSADQAVVIEALTAAIRQGTGERVLLHGVTGSGKTEVYLRAIAEARGLGRGALVLVPEIALTPQLVARFRARFGDAMAVLHSGLTEKERDDSWRRLRSGELRIAIGARSALFAPVADLGIIVVDEEHDPSFKQEEGFRYHARDLALLRAQRAGAVCVLGSATPSVETYHLAEGGRLRLLELPRRVTTQPLPTVEIVDLARHRSGPSGNPLLSAPLHRALEGCLATGGQAILFLNRRGFAPSVRCRACGKVAECPSCSVPLTEHRRAGLLQCHYCDFATRSGEICAACGAPALERLGLGTEKLEDALGAAFPGARIGRLDRDVATEEGVEVVLERLRRRELDVLVGTQMVTKGHDIPGVTLVGVVLADQSLAFPDFRASERTFQLLAQVAGRAGRGAVAGHVVLQTFQPRHPAIVHAAAHDYGAFYREELRARGELGYAPFSRLVAVRVDAGDEAKARGAAEAIARAAARLALVREGNVRVLGPAPAPIARVRGRFRYRILLRSGDRRALRQAALAALARIDEGIAPARAVVDVDPVSML